MKKDIKKTKEVKKVEKKEGFFKSHINELKKVKWPSAKEMVKYSIATLIFSVFFGLFFYGISTLFALLKGALS